MSASDKVALLAAAEFEHAGVKVICIVQVAFGAMFTLVPMQVSEPTAKSVAFVPVVLTPLKIRAPFPVFVTVIVTGALDAPASWLPKLRLAADRETAACVPVPDSAIICGLPAALSAMFREAVRPPAAAGVKETFKMQFAPPAKLEGQLFETAKSLASAPVTPMVLIARAVVAVLVSVTARGGALVVPILCGLKFKLVGEI